MAMGSNCRNERHLCKPVLAPSFPEPVVLAINFINHQAVMLSTCNSSLSYPPAT